MEGKKWSLLILQQLCFNMVAMESIRNTFQLKPIVICHPLSIILFILLSIEISSLTIFVGISIHLKISIIGLTFENKVNLSSYLFIILLIISSYSKLIFFLHCKKLRSSFLLVFKILNL